jgi:hypothetical protein
MSIRIHNAFPLGGDSYRVTYACGCKPEHRVQFKVKVNAWRGRHACEFEGARLRRLNVLKMALFGCPDAEEELYGHIHDRSLLNTGMVESWW